MSSKYSCNLIFNFSTAIFRVFFSLLNSLISIASNILFIFGISILKKSLRFEKLYTLLIPSIKLHISTTFAFFNSSINFSGSMYEKMHYSLYIYDYVLHISFQNCHSNTYDCIKKHYLPFFLCYLYHREF